MAKGGDRQVLRLGVAVAVRLGRHRVRAQEGAVRRDPHPVKAQEAVLPDRHRVRAEAAVAADPKVAREAVAGLKAGAAVTEAKGMATSLSSTKFAAL